MSDLPTPDKLPEDLKNEIDGLFPDSPERRAIAYELMFWEAWPTTAEFITVGEGHGRSESTVRDVARKLGTVNLFDKVKGSIPMYNYLRAKRDVAKELGLKDGPQPWTWNPEGAVDPVEEEENEENSGDMDEPEEDPMQGMAAFRVFRGQVNEKIGSLESDLNKFQRGMETDMGKISEKLDLVVSGLSAGEAPVPTPRDNPAPVQNNPADPLEGLSGREVYELMMNQPELFAQLTGRMAPTVGPDGGKPMSALPATVRRMIVDLTAYTQIAYEKAINDGAFDGSISDFLNRCVYKYFEDRGIVLHWGQYSQVPSTIGRPG